MRFLLTCLCLWITAHTAWAAQSSSVDTGKVVASLVSTHDTIAPGETFHIALRTELDPLWHTYWRNSGDSGEPVHIEWTLPEGVSLVGDLFWPLPGRIPTGPIINYGFEGEPLFPQMFQIDPSVEIGTVTMVEASVYYLVCKDICIPEQGDLSLTLVIGDSERDDTWNGRISDAVLSTPVTGDITGGTEINGETLSLSFTNLPDNIDISDAYFYPFERGILGHSEPQVLTEGTDGIRLDVKADYVWTETPPTTIAGVLSYKENGVYVGQEVILNVGAPVEIGASTSAPTSSTHTPTVTVLTAIFGAFIGGLILNLMPCVFPVISIKALSIAKIAHTDRQIIRREAWLYTAGVLATFLALTLTLLAFKAAGSELGWGFQLQSPKIVGALALLLFVIGLNLIGMFDIGSGLQNTGSKWVSTSGGASAFLTGALAVIVATPCTAPFMAGAIGFALAQSTLVTLLVFLSLGLGFALPFLLIAYVPALLGRLPKPGPWMVRFKEFLAFPMFAAAVWLVWVLSLQTGATGVAALLISMLLIAFALWLYKSRHIVMRIIAGACVIAALFIPFSLSATPTTSLTTDAWSPEKVAQFRAEGRAVFVDFTAAWCVTCKVNEKLVLDRPDVQALFADTQTAFLIADWTNKNDEIARELERYGRSGVPLYLMFPPGDNSVSPEILPQILSKTVLREAIDTATSR